MKVVVILMSFTLASCSSGTKSKYSGRKLASVLVAKCEAKEEGETFKMLVNENSNYRFTSPETKLEGKLQASPKIEIPDVKKLLACSGNDDSCIRNALSVKNDPEVALGKYIIDLHKQEVDVSRADEARGYFIQGHGFYMGLYEVDLGFKTDRRLQYKSLMTCQK